MTLSTQSCVVSVVLVNFRGVDDVLAAVKSLNGLSWPADRLEVVVVENGSGDDSAERLRESDLDFRLVISHENKGFAGGCNLGVRASKGDVVAFLNSDARAHPDWLSEAVSALLADEAIGAVASKVLDEEGELVDYIGAAVTWFGMGYKPLVGHSVPRAQTGPEDVLFGTGAAMVVRRDVYEKLGGFDEDYFMFFEDVDFGWRLNLAGWRFVYEPASIAYHRHHGAMEKFGNYHEIYLLERNALATLYTNLGEGALAEALPGALALAARRGVSRGGLDSTSLDLRKPEATAGPSQEVSKDTLATLFGVDQFVELLPRLDEKRRRVQSSRQVSDARLWALFGRRDAPSMGGSHYLRGYENIVNAFDVLTEPGQTKVVVVTGDPIGAKMAGPAIRAWQIATALSVDNAVALVTLTGHDGVDAPFRIAHVPAGRDALFRPWEKWADVIIFQGHAMDVFPSLASSEKILVADIYDPMHLEQLEQAKLLPQSEWVERVASATSSLNDQLERADFMVCASEVQRNLYLGQLAGLGRLSPANYEESNDFRRLIDVVPFGIESEPPVHRKDVLRGVREGFADADRILIWSGGLYDWFDPLTLIEAVAVVAGTHPEVKLFFQGTKHPHPGVPEMAIVTAARDRARDLDVLNKHVFFNDSWIEYSERANYLLEADVGVSTHFRHIETQFSFRTRILDYLWAELPMVVTEGDYFADLIQRMELGVVVPPSDVDALAAALKKALFDDDFRGVTKVRIHEARRAFYWESVLAPLVSFVANAAVSPDRRLGVRPARKRRVKTYGPAHDLRRAVHYLLHGGPRVVWDKAMTRWGRR